MNGSFYQNPTFPGANNPNNNLNSVTPPGNISFQSQMPLEQSLIENILRLNKGKKVKAYVSYPDSKSPFCRLDWTADAPKDIGCMWA